MGGRDALPQRLRKMQTAACEKKIAIECDTLEQALQAATAGADLIQFDKVECEKLTEWCRTLRDGFPQLKIIIAGGIRRENIRDLCAKRC
ncbi:hypothetical protein [Thiomicrorhabdus sp.]|uniref:hypothetical protein n=1 Tax=Thiomicrorhabdus sp. TaxID=2039724 RepID=UPI003748CB19